jgi:glycosyltransferase involved in cell wall biosynthesis
MKLNILHITPDFNYACGRSYYVYLLLKYFKQRDYNPILITNGGDSFERLDELGIEYKVIKNLHSKNPLLFKRSIEKIKDIINDLKINIIHSHHRYSELLGIRAMKLLHDKKPKTVFTALSLVKLRYNIEFKSDRIIAVSKAIEKMLLQKFNLNPYKIKLISNFIDTDELRHQEHTQLLKDKNIFNILSVGRFHPDKNYEVLLKALNLINNKNIKLTLVGEGECLSKYRKYVNTHKLNVEFILPQENLYKYFESADICVLPSRRDPFPNFMLQAGMFKKPFIGSNADGIPELITDGKNGLLFEFDNFIQLAEKIIFLKENSKQAAEFASSLHSDVMNKYTQYQAVPEIEKLYYDLLK